MPENKNAQFLSKIIESIAEYQSKLSEQKEKLSSTKSFKPEFVFEYLRSYNKFTKTPITSHDPNGVIPYTNMHDFIGTDFVYLEDLKCLNRRSDESNIDVGFSFKAFQYITNSADLKADEEEVSKELDQKVVQIIHDTILLQITLVKIINQNLLQLTRKESLSKQDCFNLVDTEKTGGISLDSMKKFMLETSNYTLKEKDFSNFLEYLGMNGAATNKVTLKEFEEIFKLEKKNNVVKMKDQLIDFGQDKFNSPSRKNINKSKLYDEQLQQSAERGESFLLNIKELGVKYVQTNFSQEDLNKKKEAEKIKLEKMETNVVKILESEKPPHNKSDLFQPQVNYLYEEKQQQFKPEYYKQDFLKTHEDVLKVVDRRIEQDVQTSDITNTLMKNISSTNQAEKTTNDKKQQDEPVGELPEKKQKQEEDGEMTDSENPALKNSIRNVKTGGAGQIREEFITKPAQTEDRAVVLGDYTGQQLNNNAPDMNGSPNRNEKRFNVSIKRASQLPRTNIDDYTKYIPDEQYVQTQQQYRDTVQSTYIDDYNPAPYESPQQRVQLSNTTQAGEKSLGMSGFKKFHPDPKFNPAEFNKNLADFSPSKDLMLYEIDTFKKKQDKFGMKFDLIDSKQPLKPLIDSPTLRQKERDSLRRDSVRNDISFQQQSPSRLVDPHRIA